MIRQFKIGGMSCQTCSDKIVSNLLAHPDVVNTTVYLSPKIAVVEMSRDIPVSELREIISTDKLYFIKYEILDFSITAPRHKKRFLQAISHFFQKIFSKQNCCKGVILFSLAFFQANAQIDTGSISKVNTKKIPSVAIKDLYGNVVSTSSFTNKGKPMIIIFWYSVHRFPSKELNAIEENCEAWKKETGVKVIIVSVDDSRTATNVLPIVNAKGWDFEFYLDINSDFKRAMNVNLLPHTFLISGSREIVWQSVGFIEGDETTIYDELKKLRK